MARDNGGPAFPSASEYDHGDRIFERTSGMSLRDYFAAHAPEMPAAFRDIWVPLNLGTNWLEVELMPPDEIRMRIAWRWDYADQMIAERGKA